MRAVFEDLESHWRECWEHTADAQTFLETLTGSWLEARRLNAGGSLTSVSRNSTSQSYAPPAGGNRTLIESERIALEAVKLYEQLRDLLSLTDETDIYNQGLFQLAAPPTEAYSDSTVLRLL